MDLAIDLRKLLQSGSLDAPASRLIKRLLGQTSIVQDLSQCGATLMAAHHWQQTRVFPKREGLFDQGPDAVIGGSIVQSAALYMARAFDEASKARNKIRFEPRFRELGLVQHFEAFDRFRNYELAHYGGLEDRGRLYSDDNVVLKVNDDGTAFMSVAFMRTFASSPIVESMVHLLDPAIEYAQGKVAEGEDAFFRVLATDVRIRRLVEQEPEKFSFDPIAFWKGDKRASEQPLTPLSPPREFRWETKP